MDVVEAPLLSASIQHPLHIYELVGHAWCVVDFRYGRLQLKVKVRGGLFETFVDRQVVFQEVLRAAKVFERVLVCIEMHGDKVDVKMVIAAVEHGGAAQRTEAPASVEDPEVVIAESEFVVNIFTTSLQRVFNAALVFVAFDMLNRPALLAVLDLIILEELADGVVDGGAVADELDVKA